MEDWQDKEIFEGYVAKIDVDEDVYKSFSKQELKFEDIAEIEYFKMYLDALKQIVIQQSIKGQKHSKISPMIKKQNSLGLDFISMQKISSLKNCFISL